MKTLDEALNVFDCLRILVNTVPETVRDQRLRSNLKKMNDEIIAKCNSIQEMSVINSRYMPLKDNIHFTSSSIQNIASKVIDSINYTSV